MTAVSSRSIVTSSADIDVDRPVPPLIIKVSAPDVIVELPLSDEISKEVATLDIFEFIFATQSST